MRAEHPHGLQRPNHEHEECEDDRQNRQCRILESPLDVPEAITLLAIVVFPCPGKAYSSFSVVKYSG